MPQIDACTPSNAPANLGEGNDAGSRGNTIASLASKMRDRITDRGQEHGDRYDTVGWKFANWTALAEDSVAICDREFQAIGEDPADLIERGSFTQESASAVARAWQARSDIWAWSSERCDAGLRLLVQSALDAKAAVQPVELTCSNFLTTDNAIFKNELVQRERSVKTSFTITFLDAFILDIVADKQVAAPAAIKSNLTLHIPSTSTSTGVKHAGKVIEHVVSARKRQEVFERLVERIDLDIEFLTFDRLKDLAAALEVFRQELRAVVRQRVRITFSYHVLDPSTVRDVIFRFIIRTGCPPPAVAATRASAMLIAALRSGGLNGFPNYRPPTARSRSGFGPYAGFANRLRLRPRHRFHVFGTHARRRADLADTRRCAQISQVRNVRGDRRVIHPGGVTKIGR